MDRQKSWYIALTYRDYRLLWVGELISSVGTNMQYVALSWQLYILTHSALALGLIGIARFLPILFLSLLGGNFADVHNRKRILYITQTVIFFSSFLLALTTFSHTISVPLMYALTALVAGATSFDLPARQSLIPSLVKREDLQNALSIHSVIFELASILGPSLAGFVIATAGVGPVYVVDFVSTLAVLLALFGMHTNGEVSGSKVVISFNSMKEGIRFVQSKTIIWSTMLLDFFSTFFASAMALLPIFAKDILRVGPQGLGLLVAAPAVGSVIAAFGMARFGSRIQQQGRVLLISVCIYAFATVLFGLSHMYAFSLLSLSLIGAGDTVSMVIRQTVRQLVTPDYIRGRMMSVNQIFFMGGPHLGEFEAGLLASWFGAPITVVIGGVATLIVVGVMAMAIPSMRKYTLEKQPIH